MSRINPPKSEIRFFLRKTLLALLFFLIVTGLMMTPLLVNISTALPGGGDVYEYVWKLWWFKHSLLTLGQSPWIAPHIYYPFGFPLAFGETTTANTLLAIPLLLWFDEIVTFNLLVFWSRVLAGFTTFLLAREITGSHCAGLLAGIIFAYASYNQIHLVHLNLTATFWLPLIFLFLERFARTGRYRYGLMAGVAFGMNALASWYYAVAAGFFVPIWGLIRFQPLRTLFPDRNFWLALLLFVSTTAALVVPAAWPYLPIQRSADTTIPMENSNFYSASLTDYLIPSPAQFLWGDWVRSQLLNRPAPGEFAIGVGLISILFAAYGWTYAARSTTWPWLAVTLLAVLLSMGLTLHFAGRQVVIPATAAVSDTVNQALNTISLNLSLTNEPYTIGGEDGLAVPLPALLMRWFVPVLGKMRTWSRFGLIALLGVSILAAIGAAAWHRRELTSPTRQRVGWLVVLGLVLFEFWWAPLSLTKPRLSRPVDDWLAQRPAGAIIEYPIESGFDPAQMIYTRTHGKPIVQGNSTYFSFVFSRRHPELISDFPNPTALETLANWQVRYVLVNTAPRYQPEVSALLANIAASECFLPLTVQDQIYVFELVDCTQF